MENNIKTQHIKLFLPIFWGGIFCVSFFIIGFIIENTQKKQKTEISPSQTESPQKKNRDFDPKPFGMGGELLSSDKTVTYTDQTFPITFHYPKTSYIRTLPPYKDDTVSRIFLLTGTSSTKEEIDSAADCIISNRTFPSGLCREGSVGDIEIGISEFKSQTSYPEEKQRYCDKKSTQQKIIYSCLGSGLALWPSTYYVAYIQKNGKTFVISLDPRDTSWITGTALRTIGETLQ